MGIGVKVVFADLRAPLLLSLYVPCVEETRLATALRELDSELGLVFHAMPDADAREQLIGEIFRSALCAFEAVLLDPHRALRHTDVPLLRADYELLVAFFHADGRGLPVRMIEP